MSPGAMLKMMKEFFGGWWRYRPEIREHEAWIATFIRKKGWAVNQHWMFRTNLEIWLTESEKTFGRRYCPCFEPGGTPEANQKLLCPCPHADVEIARHGTCHCVLFGRSDLPEADWRRAEARLVEEYRGVPLKLAGDTLDTRGMVRDPLRDLPVPDALHQVNRAFGATGSSALRVVVATEAEARNQVAAASFRGRAATIEREGEGWTVTVRRAT